MITSRFTAAAGLVKLCCKELPLRCLPLVRPERPAARSSSRSAFSESLLPFSGEVL